jgi:hypothetical protein
VSTWFDEEPEYEPDFDFDDDWGEE